MNTIASTSGLLDILHKTSQKEVFERLDIPRKWFTAPTKMVRPIITTHPQELKVDPFDVIAGAGHDHSCCGTCIPYEHEKRHCLYFMVVTCGTGHLTSLS